MAQKENPNYMNFGGDDYFDPCNKENFYYEDNDYKLDRYKETGSMIIREKDKDGKIVGIILDIGLSHHQHGVTQDLSADRLFLNKIDPHRMRIDDMRDTTRIAENDNLTAEDWRNRMYRVGKLVDRDVFHEQLGYIDEDRGHHPHYFHYHYPLGFRMKKRKR